VWFSLTWSLELYQQTIARIYRQGQIKPVVVEHLVVKDSIEERVMSALTSKQTTQDALLDAVKAELTRKD
jgi:phage-associated helicase